MADNIWLTMFDKYLTGKENRTHDLEMQGNQLGANSALQTNLARMAEQAAMERQRAQQASQKDIASMQIDAESARARDQITAMLLPHLGKDLKVVPPVSGAPLQSDAALPGIYLGGQRWEGIPMAQQIKDTAKAQWDAKTSEWDEIAPGLSKFIDPETLTRAKIAHLTGHPVAQDSLVEIFDTLSKKMHDQTLSPDVRRQAEMQALSLGKFMQGTQRPYNINPGWNPSEVGAGATTTGDPLKDAQDTLRNIDKIAKDNNLNDAQKGRLIKWATDTVAKFQSRKPQSALAGILAEIKAGEGTR